MQKGSFTEQTPRFDTEGVVDRINTLAALFRKHDLPVFCVQHDGSGSGEFEKDSWSWENLDELLVNSSDILIDKYANDIFYRSQLQTQLAELNIRDLLITGCATDFCVASTVQSALAKDFNVIVVADAHTTADRPHLKAEKVIEHYNWVWRNMLPTEGRVAVKSFEEIKGQLTTTANFS